MYVPHTYQGKYFPILGNCSLIEQASKIYISVGCADASRAKIVNDLCDDEKAKCLVFAKKITLKLSYLKT